MSIIVHLKAVGHDLFVAVEDVLANKEALPRTFVKKGELVYPSVTTDKRGRGHIKWNSVTPKDENDECRWGNADVPSADESTVYEITATSAVKGTLECK